MNPIIIWLYRSPISCNRAGWTSDAGIGRRSSASVDRRVAGKLKRQLVECGRLSNGRHRLARRPLALAGKRVPERRSTAYVTYGDDKDGIIMNSCGRNHGQDWQGSGRLYRELRTIRAPVYERIDAPATPEQKAVLSKLSPSQVKATELAGDKITAMLTIAPGNGAAIGGLKVVTDQGWFAARPSGTEDVYKLYAESFRGKEHLVLIQEEAQALIARALAG